MLEALFVCGTWDENGGKPSGFMHKLANELRDFYNIQVFNGGRYSDLTTIISKVSTNNIVFWFPDVSNNEYKLVQDIKRYNKKVILITSKRNDEGRYSDLALVAHTLKNKSNLLLELSRVYEDCKIFGRIIDPLGNIICSKTSVISCLTRHLVSRIHELYNFTRIESTYDSSGDYFPSEIKPISDFITDVGILAERFHNIIHADTGRFLGNCSFRCEEGFPSFRTQSRIFVSKRNLDKRKIEYSPESFVEVNSSGYEDILKTSGDKASVDAPIQNALYKFYPHINFMLHSHVYIKDATVTSRMIPCGAMEEFYELLRFLPKKSINFAINLKGHGCLLGTSDYTPGKFLAYEFESR